MRNNDHIRTKSFEQLPVVRPTSTDFIFLTAYACFCFICFVKNIAWPATNAQPTATVS
jgi:hypothetical protein